MKNTSLFVLFALIFNTITAQTYTLTDNEVVVENGLIKSCSYSFELKNIIVPQTLDGQTVTGIDEYVFYSKGITSLKLPATIQTIGHSAFSSNSITSLDLSGGTALTAIGNGAFYGNKLTDIDLSGNTSLKTIGYNAFGYNKLESFNLSGCTALESIGYDAFRSNDLKDISLSGCISLKTIGSYAFYNYNTTSIDIKGCKSLLFIDSYAFYQTASGFELPEVTYNGTIYKVWKDESNNSYTAGTNKATTSNTFYILYIPYTLTDADVVVEDGLIKSCSYSFELKNILIPQTLDGQTVTGIDEYVFYSKGITSLKLPATIQSIGNNAFSSNSITSLDLSGGKALNAIGNGAFYGNKLTDIDLSGNTSLKTIGHSAFSSNKLTAFNLSGCTALESIGYNAFISNNLKDISLSGCTSLKTIGSYAFYNYNTTSIDIKGCKSLLFIDSYAFYQTASGFELPEVTYDGAIYKVWKDQNNNSYTAGTDKVTIFSTSYIIDIPYILKDNDVVVEKGIIKSCSYSFELKSIIIPQILDGQTITEIDSRVFTGKGIREVKFPLTIKKIANEAFYYNNISELNFSECKELQAIDNNAFSSNKLVSLNISGCSNLLSLGTNAFSNNTNLSGFILPEASIPSYFYNIWTDKNGTKYNAGVTVSNLSTSYFRTMPAVTKIYSTYANTSGNKEISLFGENFESQKNNKQILFNGKEALNITFWSDTLIKAICPPNPAGTAEIALLLENNIRYVSPKQLLYIEGEVIELCGDISGILSKGKSYLLTCNCSVPSDKILSIEPGVRIIADHNVENKVNLLVKGTLNAIGTKYDSIKFTALKKGDNYWEGISVENIATFKYVSVSDAKYGIMQGNGVTNISHSRFFNNEFGIYHDAIYEYLTSDISDCNISQNKYGIYSLAKSKNDNGSATVKINNCTVGFNINTGIYLYASGSTGSAYEWVSVHSSSFVNMTIANTRILKNGISGISANAYGYEADGSPFNIYRYAHIDLDITNVIIDDNTTGISYYQNPENSYATLKIKNADIVNNSAQGINNTRGSVYSYNSIYWGNNQNDIIESNSDSLLFEYNCIQNNPFGGNNISMNPLFDSADTTNFDLQSASPCIDAGSNDFAVTNKDMDYNFRIWDGNNDDLAIVDMGPLEFGAPCAYGKDTVEICEGQSYEGETTPGTYRFQFQDSDSIVDITLIVNKTPEKPSIDIIENELISSSVDGNQWYFEQLPINGATNQTYNITQPGKYSVQVTNEKGCTSEMSEDVNITITALSEINNRIFAYPNPTTGILYIEGLLKGRVFLVTIYNTMGQKIGQKEINALNSTIDLSSYESGIYYLRCNNDSNCTLKIMKK